MQLERAILYINDYASKEMDCAYTQAMNTVVMELRELQKENKNILRMLSLIIEDMKLEGYFHNMSYEDIRKYYDEREDL